ncbi:DoxX family membrane protein, partial [Phytoactinopolyspora endophytica]
MFRSPIIRDAVLLLARVGIGAVFIAHGWQKLS